MANMYPHLLSPMKIGKHVFKNRILCGPLGYNQENLSASMSQDNIDFFGALARGGTARVTTGDCMVADDAGYNGGGGRPKFYAPPQEIMSSVRTYVNTIHRYNCLAFVQLGHNGPPTPQEYDTGGHMDTVYERAAKISEALNTYDEAKLQSVIQDYIRCVRNLRMGGMDGIIIHAGHGAKLLDQLRSPLTNRRTDKYGGSFENRIRFTVELLRALRAEMGDMILEYRFSGREYVEGGIELDETIECLKILEQEGLADIFHVSGGLHISPAGNMFVTSPGTFPPAVFREDVKKIKAAGIRTPIAIVNSLADPDISEDILASGDADFIVMSRQINLADPYYPRKLREGKPWMIDTCLRCHGCFDVVGPCSVNPYATFKTYESSYELPLAKTKRKVCIVGGGIAGLKAAFTAAERGHRVILFEKENALGGQLRFSDTDTYKFDIRRYKNNMIRRVEEHPNIEIRLNTAVTPEMIEKELPCSLIVAIGAEQKTPAIPGVDGPNVMKIMESYLEPERVGERVIMLGSGLTACEVGLHLNRVGKKVSIVGRREGICFHENFNVMPTAVFSPIPTYLGWFKDYGIELYDNSDVVEILPSGVRIRNTVTGEESVIEGDTVILAAGVQARQEEAMSYNDVGAESFSIVGDCIEAHKIRQAVSTAFWAAMEL